VSGIQRARFRLRHPGHPRITGLPQRGDMINIHSEQQRHACL